MSEFVARCPCCKSRCPEVYEDPTKTPSRCVLVEANQFTRKAAKNELDEKVKAWSQAAPPMNLSSPRFAINLVALEEAKVLVNGSVVLREEREHVPLDSQPDEDQQQEDEEETIDTSDDDDSRTVSDDSA